MKFAIILITLIIIPAVLSVNVTEICYNKTIPDFENECNARISITTDKENYNNKEKITLYNNLTTKADFIIEYWIENSSGSIIKEKINTTNLNAKSYTLNLKSSDTLKIKNKLIYIACNNTNNLTTAEKQVFVYVYQDTSYFFEVSKIYLNKDKTVALNDTIKSKINLYTGNLSNQTLKIEIENITASVEYLSVYSTYNLTTSTKIPEDCNITSDNYTLKIKAFDIEVNETIYIKNNCKEGNLLDIGDNSSDIEYLSHPESNINLTESPITGNVIYESSAEKTKKISIYLILIILIMALVYVVPSKIISKTAS